MSDEWLCDACACRIVSPLLRRTQLWWRFNDRCWPCSHRRKTSGFFFPLWIELYRADVNGGTLVRKISFGYRSRGVVIVQWPLSFHIVGRLPDSVFPLWIDLCPGWGKVGERSFSKFVLRGWGATYRLVSTPGEQCSEICLWKIRKSLTSFSARLLLIVSGLR
jgi:hypothetical protein